ncbi:class I SAM-dependent methyltransferase [Gulosibacter molinativorax]|uniref:Class I SAM-dependent methyltransferase n=1 Tax=Gulosibacter molinativorax TaxID=256821 RepID=A0ABT7C7P8_9MICO|nr:methyltransferase [Gulosibacter molinativorax]MDJ1371214.1 class I SAM-dependent methyltransferase [Gulosibacter molinativorax]QUY63030.1 Ribosomal RNA large subunit methyltransferase G [Gulosibacter molinativorax]
MSDAVSGEASAGRGGTALHDDPVVDVVLAEALDTGAVPGAVAVIDDAEAAFVAPLFALGAQDVRVFSDFGVGSLRGPEASRYASLLDEREAAVSKGVVREETPDGSLFTDVTLVVGRLPKSLAELEDLAQCIHRQAAPDARVILGAREKHLTRSMNEVLGKYFADVRGTRGMRKSRAIVATGRIPDAVTEANAFPRTAQLEELDLVVAARGGAFAGTTLDLGTRVLLQSIPGDRPGTVSLADVVSDGEPSIHTAVDLGCGTGLLAAVLARSFADANVIATDASWWACASAEQTAEANGFAERIEVLRANAGAGIEPGSVDLVLCNPPFHDGRQVDPGLANELFRGAARMLRSGGLLVTVFNSHLKHRQHLENIVGPTQQLNRTEKFTVTVSERR